MRALLDREPVDCHAGQGIVTSELKKRGDGEVQA